MHVGMGMDFVGGGMRKTARRRMHVGRRGNEKDN
jgi:hypothetical protein